MCEGVIKLYSVLAVSAGAALGAVLRWMAAVLMNDFFPDIPLGTLFVNISGGFLIGVAVSFFNAAPHIPAEWRLLVVTGFLGGLTTFSAFSIESVMLLKSGKYLLFATSVFLHLGGSLVATLIGVSVFKFFKA